MSIAAPNYTQVPNALIDEMMPEMTESELRVSLVITRNTFGWHKDTSAMSLSFLQKATGMSRQGVINGINGLLDKQLIEKIPDGDSYAYRLIVFEPDSEPEQTNEVDQTSQLSGPPVVNEVDQTSQRSRPILVNEVDTINKGKKKEKNKPQSGGRADVRAKVFDRLEQQWLTVNALQVEKHSAIAKHYGFEAWLRGFEQTPNGKRSNAAYVEKVVADVADELAQVNMPPPQPSVVYVPAGAL